MRRGRATSRGHTQQFRFRGYTPPPPNGLAAFQLSPILYRVTGSIDLSLSCYLLPRRCELLPDRYRCAGRTNCPLWVNSGHVRIRHVR